MSRVLGAIGVGLRLLALVLVAQAALFNSPAQIRDGGIDPRNLGKGDWLYSITDATNKLGNHVASVTNETSLMQFYKTQGIRYMIVKAGTGATLFNGCYAFPQFSAGLVNTIIANNSINNGTPSDVAGSFSSSGYNLIGTISGSSRAGLASCAPTV